MKATEKREKTICAYILRKDKDSYKKKHCTFTTCLIGTTGTSVVSSETSGGAETTGPSAEKSRTTLPTIAMTEIIGSSTEESRATRPSTGRYSPNVSSAVGSQTSRQSTEGSSENGPTEVVTDI